MTKPIFRASSTALPKLFVESSFRAHRPLFSVLQSSRPQAFQPPRRSFTTYGFKSPSSVTPLSPNHSSFRFKAIGAIVGAAFAFLGGAFFASQDDFSVSEHEALQEGLGIQAPPSETLLSIYLEAAYQKCLQGDWKTIKDLSPLLARLRDLNGTTLLGLAIKNCDPVIVRNLLKAKIGVEEKDQEGNTPLHLAANLEAFLVMPELLKAFSASARNDQGETPVHLALRKGSDASLKILIEKTHLKKHSKDGGSLLHFAVSCGQFQMIDYLISQHWEEISSLIESRNQQGLTPLALASYLGESQALYILAKKAGASIEATDSKGNTPLHLVCQSGQIETLDTLFYLGADHKVYNHEYQTPEKLATKQVEVHFDALVHQKREPQNPHTLPIKNLVFQGGGSKGLAYLPIIELLEQQKILEGVEKVAGTSAGAITAALLAVDYSSKEITEFLEAQKLTDFLDPQEGITPNYQKHVDQAICFWRDHTLGGYLTNKAIQAFKAGQRGGLCSGQVFRDWMEDKIFQATKIENCTFGELSDLVRQGKAKHLHVFGTKLGNHPESVEINSVDSKWKDVIISDAIRLSMSIPDVYEPYPIYVKQNGKRQIWESEGYFIDGGVLNNFPIHTFDTKKYKNTRSQEENPKTPWHNPHTIGFSLYSSDSKKQENTHLLSVTKQLPSMYLEHEMIIKEREEKSMERVVRINNQGISLLTFDIPEKTKTALLNEARKKATIFLENHSLTNLALLDLPYNYSLFKQKELAGKVHLPPLNSHFIGRENELRALKKALIKKDYQQKTAEVSLVADRGYGKSELALAFAFLNLEAFSLTWTLDFRNPESLETSYRKLAKTLKISTNALALQDIQVKVHTKLENAEEPWLLIFDNVDQGFIPSHPKKGGALLFTSSHPHTFDSKSPLHLSKLTEGEALVKKILGKNDPELPHLAQDLRGIPLLLQQAASYIQESQITISEYRTLLSQASPKPLEKQTYEELLKTTWAIASTSLQTHLKEAYNWLIMSSFLDTKNIPKNWLDTFLTNQPSLKSHLKSQEILNFLKNYGLISFYKYDTTFSLHGYFQQIIRPEADEPLQAHLPFLLNLQEIKDYNPTKPEAAQAFQKIVHHTAEVLNHLKTPSKEASRLGLTLVRYLLETPRDLDKGEAYLNLTKSLTPPNHPAQGRLAFFAGELAKKKAQDAPAEEKEALYKQALENFTNAHAIFSNNYPQEDYLHLEQNPDKCTPPYQRAICLEYQGQMLLRLGKLKQAKQKLKQANQELKILHPSGEHFDIARIKREQGNILLQQGDTAGAITKIQKALELQKKVYKERFESHSTVAATYSALAEAHLTQEEKDLEQADTCYQIAITTNEKAYKTENHPYIARLYGKRAEIAQALGKAEEAEAFKKKQQEIKEAIERNKAES